MNLRAHSQHSDTEVLNSNSQPWRTIQIHPAHCLEMMNPGIQLAQQLQIHFRNPPDHRLRNRRQIKLHPNLGALPAEIQQTAILQIQILPEYQDPKQIPNPMEMPTKTNSMTPSTTNVSYVTDSPSCSSKCKTCNSSCTQCADPTTRRKQSMDTLQKTHLNTNHSHHPKQLPQLRMLQRRKPRQYPASQLNNPRGQFRHDDAQLWWLQVWNN